MYMREKIKEFLNKKSVKNGMWLYMLQFFNMVVPLLTLPYITRILGSSVYGIFSIALNIVNYLVVVVEYGFPMSATRKVAIDSNKELLNKTFTTVIIGRLLLLLLSILFSIVYIFFNRDNLQLVFSFAILLICLLGNCVQMNWLFQGMQDMKIISIINVVSRIISVTLIFCFVKTQKDLLLYSLLYSISPFLSGFIGIVVAKKKYALHFVNIKMLDVKNELKEGFYVFTTQLSSKVFGTIGITFLSFFASSSDVGVFSAIQKIPNIMLLLWMPIAQVIYPIASKKFMHNYFEGLAFVIRMQRIFLPLFVVLAGGVGVSGKFILNIAFGEEYSEFYYWLFPLLAWMVVAIVNNFIGIQTLLGSGHDKEYGEAFQIGIILTVLINLLLTKTFMGFGAALAPVISEIVLNILLRIKLKKITAQVLLSDGN